MRRLLLTCLVLGLCVLGLFVPSTAAPLPTRGLVINGGTVTEMYPAFDPAIDRYAVTTTADTGGSADVAATPGPGETVQVSVDGTPAADPTHLTGLASGQRIRVSFIGGVSPHSYTVMYLPAGFPKLSVQGLPHASYPDLEPGLVAVTLNAFSGPSYPAFDAIVDRNGVPAYAVHAAPQDLDLKQQPTGEITVQQPPVTPPNTGIALVTLDPAQGLAPEATRRTVVAPLTNTDGHDSVRLTDGSTILIGYEPNSVTGNVDATIQKLDAAGHETFRWTSAPYAAETTAGANTDYAHINSVVSVENGDIIASFRHLSAVYRIATVDHGPHHAGDVIWKLGGRDSSFAFVDDPAGGPCAQHAVTELPDGHILVFDNGTSGYCVDQSDPGGATIARGYTRVAEYALDLNAVPKPTATLVWSYPDDQSKYAFFAGSARRMANGDTLIGWAADRDVLATEVDASKNDLWDLTTPVTDGSNTARYMTYRAELVTALRPRITAAVADGATVLAGDDLPGGPQCSNWRGEALDCTVAGLSNGRLDTTTVGMHTWQVSAEDGAGNTTAVTLHYTVRLPGRQPDALVRKAGSTIWKGGDVYGGASDQSVRERIRRTHTRSVAWQIQNDGERGDAFRLVAAGSNRRVRVHYFAGGVDVTSAVVAGTYVTPTLQPGQSVTFAVTVKPTQRARVGSTRTVTMAAVSVGDASRADRVAAVVTVRR